MHIHFYTHINSLNPLKMNMSTLLLTRTRGCGKFFRKVICKNLSTLPCYQVVPTAPTCSFHSLCGNALITRKDCGVSYASYTSSSSGVMAVAGSNKSKDTEEQLYLKDDDKTSFKENQKQLEFPGGKIAFTSEMNFLPGSSEERVQCYRVLDEDGNPISSNMPHNVNKELALKVYTSMVTLQTMDTLFNEAQRQGRFSFYLSSLGEEAISIASAASLTSDDHILSQYREQGVLLWRGFTLQEFANHFLGNKVAHERGRNMPHFFGSKKLNFFTNSAPLATQLPQAVGIAYSLKMDKKDACVVAYCGDGCTSEGDFHAGMNFAAVLEAPVVFICRNNGWAISTPVTEQFRSDGVVVKGQAYGIQSIRVDGNDALAVYDVVQSARKMAINEQRPILIEAMTYRVGDHSTSDDSTKYRTKDEIEHWKIVHSPISRFRKWIERKGWWSQKEETDIHIDVQERVKEAIKKAENEEKPSIKDMFTDVYQELPANLTEQEKLLREAVNRHPEDFPKDVPL